MPHTTPDTQTKKNCNRGVNYCGDVCVCVCVCVCVHGEGGGGGLARGCFNKFYSRETPPFILMQLQIQIYVRSTEGSSTVSVKHHSESHIIKTQWRDKANGSKAIGSQNTREPQIGPRWARPRILIVRRLPSETDWGGSRHTVCGPTQRSVIKEGSKVINHSWELQPCRQFAAEIHIITYFFVASDNL